MRKQVYFPMQKRKLSQKLNDLCSDQSYVALDCALRCLDTQPMGCWVFLLLEDTDIGISRLSMYDCSPPCGWASSNQLRACIEG